MQDTVYLRSASRDPKPPRSNFTGYYWRLNTFTIPSQHSLFLIEDSLEEFRGKVFSLIHIRKAFHRISTMENHFTKAVILTPFGLLPNLSLLGSRNAAQPLQLTTDYLL